MAPKAAKAQDEVNHEQPSTQDEPASKQEQAHELGESEEDESEDDSASTASTQSAASSASKKKVRTMHTRLHKACISASVKTHTCVSRPCTHAMACPAPTQHSSAHGTNHSHHLHQRPSWYPIVCRRKRTRRRRREVARTAKREEMVGKRSRSSNSSLASARQSGRP